MHGVSLISCRCQHDVIDDDECQTCQMRWQVGNLAACCNTGVGSWPRSRLGLSLGVGLGLWSVEPGAVVVLDIIIFLSETKQHSFLTFN